MKRLLYLAVVLALVAAAYWAGSRRGRQNCRPESRETRKILYYVDPMNPAHTSDKPGNAPCGMDMEPVYADATPVAPPAPNRPRCRREPSKSRRRNSSSLASALATVEKKRLLHNLRLLGKVATDETRIYRINATVDGWITKALPSPPAARSRRMRRWPNSTARSSSPPPRP